MLTTTLPTLRNGATPFALFDRVLDELAQPGPVGAHAAGHDLVQTGPDAYRLELPVPGYGEGDLEIVTKQRELVVKAGARAPIDGETVLRRGITRDGFEHRFVLGEHIRVEHARLVDGMLTIELVRDVPEALKPRTIDITRGN